MKKQLFLPFACLVLFTLNLAAQAIPNEELLAKYPTTSITFDESEFNFGKVAVGEKVQHIYRFTNTGDEPLLLQNVKGSCGCTVPSWPKDFIEPGSSGAIVVEFDTKGKMGPQVKQVTITANTDPAQSVVYIKGEVFASKTDDPALLPTPAPPIQKTEPAKPVANIGVMVYPNPASTFLTVEMKDAMGKEVSMEVFNGNGQLMDRQEVGTLDNSNFQLDVRKYEAGTYWLSVKLGEAERVSLPFVIAR